MTTEFGILGELRMLQDGRAVDLGPPRQRALLACLLIARTSVTADHLLEDLWPQDAPETAPHALHVYVSRLRRALGTDGTRLTWQGSGYRLDVEPEELDAACFEDLVGEGRVARAREDPETAGQRLHAALDLWRGPALAEFADESFAREEATRLEELRLAALEERIWADLELGRSLEVVDELEGLVAECPYREAFAEQLMLALYRCGRQADALRAYQAQRTRLAEELGIDPGPALRRMEERVLAQDPGLDATPREIPAAELAGMPLQRTSFIGREQELDQASELLAHTRLLTLTGAPGSGKTRLGLRIADRTDDFPDGAFFVPLADVSDPRFVAGAIARVLDLRESRDVTTVDVLKTHLRGRRVLLLVDNFEHLIDAATGIGELLDAAPELKILVTSRSPLGLSGEQVFPVPPLGIPPLHRGLEAEELHAYDAVALFLARARARDPGFEFGAEHAGLVAEIATRLDGLPLAIELAAARVRLLTLDELRDRLGERLDVLAGGPADSEARHRTMRAAIEWSYELLAAPEKELLRRLSVFRREFTVDAAVHVVGEAQAAIEAGIESLLSKSLLHRPVSVGRARFSMLELIREFALEELAAIGQERETLERHADHYARLGEEVEPRLSGENPGDAIERLSPELDNIRAALRHALATRDADVGLRLASSIWRFWQSTGQLQEGRYWLEGLLDVDGGSEAVRAKGYTALAGLAYWQGDFEASKADYVRARDLYREVGDRFGEADALYSMSMAATLGGDPGVAVQLAREAKVIFEELGAEEQVLQVLLAEGTATWATGDLPAARSLWESGLTISRQRGDRALEASQRVGLAGIVLQQGDVPGALRSASEALDVAIETGNEHTQVFALDGVATCAVSSDPTEAVRLAAAAATLRDAHGGGWSLEAMGVESARTAAAAAFTPAEIERAWRDGSQMSLEEAIDLGRRLLAGSS